MPRRKELPFTTIPSAEDDIPHEPPGRPMRVMAYANQIEALMQAAPHAPIEEWTADRQLPLREVIADAIDQVLDPREKWIFDRLIVERRSIRSVAVDLGISKSYVHIIKQEAVKRLRVALAEHPLITAYLGRHDQEEANDGSTDDQRSGQRSKSDDLGVRRETSGTTNPRRIRKAA